MFRTARWIVGRLGWSSDQLDGCSGAQDGRQTNSLDIPALTLVVMMVFEDFNAVTPWFGPPRNDYDEPDTTYGVAPVDPSGTASDSTSRRSALA
jgi:hypothetical protein